MKLLSAYTLHYRATVSSLVHIYFLIMLHLIVLRICNASFLMTLNFLFKKNIKQPNSPWHSALFTCPPPPPITLSHLTHECTKLKLPVKENKVKGPGGFSVVLVGSFPPSFPFSGTNKLWARSFKLLRSPTGIDFKEPFPPAYVARRAGTTTPIPIRFLVP